MANKEIKTRGRGRPAGSGHGTQTVMVIRNQFEQALDILKRDKNVTLAQLIAEGLTESTSSMNQTLSVISKFMPRDIDLKMSGGSFADALSNAADIMRSNNAQPIVIDQEIPEKEKENKDISD